MSAASEAAGRLGETQRRDPWWLAPLAVAAGLGLFVFYATWAAFQGAHYAWGPYLSPFYSPEIFGTSPHAWFGPRPAGWPTWLPYSPAFLILWAPGGFRLTCYYYRKAYYRAYFLDPPACAVGEARSGYRGETSFPFILQNLHRYFLYLALLFLVFLWHDVWKACWWDDTYGGREFGIGLGTLVLFANTTLLSLYTLSCHSWRHIVGGCLDCFSQASLGRLRHRAWERVSRLNERHMLWAWLSLFMVGFADLYVRMVSMGIWRDLRFF